MRRSRAFTLVELLVVIGIIGILVSIVIPLASKARASALSVKCASNLRQVGTGLLAYFNDFKQLPVRDAPLDVANPHVFKYGPWEPNIADAMQKYGGSRAIYFCPANSIERNLETWWPYTSGTIAGTYQYPHWLSEWFWMIPRPDYRKLTSQRILATDYLGVTTDSSGAAQVVAWNHDKIADGSPRGMNMLYGDNHVEWRPSSNGWQIFGFGFGNIYWFYAK